MIYRDVRMMMWRDTKEKEKRFSSWGNFSTPSLLFSLLMLAEKGKAGSWVILPLSIHPSIHACIPHVSPPSSYFVSLSLRPSPSPSPLCEPLSALSQNPISQSWLLPLQDYWEERETHRKRARARERDGKHCQQKSLTRIFSTLARPLWFDHREQRKGNK